ncbi:MAG: M23 family metallopeptidase [Treponema sp.]|nr:M23 family metallopeptidase [Treponema sp.]
MLKNNKIIISVLVFLQIQFSAFSFEKKIEKEKLPEIPNLSSRNEIFKEFSAIVDENYKALASGQEPLMLFFKVQVPEKTNLLSLSARCNIPYETLATLNNLNSNIKNIEGKELIIPTVPGLFINLESSEPLQVILKTRCIEILQNDNMCYTLGKDKFSFLQNQRFSPTERAYFLDTALGLPIDASLSYISSSFGPRINPFSGEWKNHNGVDFAASEGVPVYAIKSGKISLAKKNDTVFGNYIILKHNDSEITSVYAHLSKMTVYSGDIVNRGDIIGYVGQTGMATGPHLHFEIRFGGIAENPEKVLPIK